METRHNMQRSLRSAGALAAPSQNRSRARGFKHSPSNKGRTKIAGPNDKTQSSEKTASNEKSLGDKKSSSGASQEKKNEQTSKTQTNPGKTSDTSCKTASAPEQVSLEQSTRRSKFRSRDTPLTLRGKSYIPNLKSKVDWSRNTDDDSAEDSDSSNDQKNTSSTTNLRSRSIETSALASGSKVTNSATSSGKASTQTLLGRLRSDSPSRSPVGRVKSSASDSSPSSRTRSRIVDESPSAKTSPSTRLRTSSTESTTRAGVAHSKAACSDESSKSSPIAKAKVASAESVKQAVTRSAVVTRRSGTAVKADVEKAQSSEVNSLSKDSDSNKGTSEESDSKPNKVLRGKRQVQSDRGQSMSPVSRTRSGTPLGRSQVTTPKASTPSAKPSASTEPAGSTSEPEEDAEASASLDTEGEHSLVTRPLCSSSSPESDHNYAKSDFEESDSVKGDIRKVATSSTPHTGAGSDTPGEGNDGFCPKGLGTLSTGQSVGRRRVLRDHANKPPAEAQASIPSDARGEGHGSEPQVGLGSDKGKKPSSQSRAVESGPESVEKNKVGQEQQGHFLQKRESLSRLHRMAASGNVGAAKHNPEPKHKNPSDTAHANKKLMRMIKKKLSRNTKRLSRNVPFSPKSPSSSEELPPLTSIKRPRRLLPTASGRNLFEQFSSSTYNDESESSHEHTTPESKQIQETKNKGTHNEAYSRQDIASKDSAVKDSSRPDIATKDSAVEDSTKQDIASKGSAVKGSSEKAKPVSDPEVVEQKTKDVSQAERLKTRGRTIERLSVKSPMHEGKDRMNTSINFDLNEIKNPVLPSDDASSQPDPHKALTPPPILRKSSRQLKKLSLDDNPEVDQKSEKSVNCSPLEDEEDRLQRVGSSPSVVSPSDVNCQMSSPDSGPTFKSPVGDGAEVGASGKSGGPIPKGGARWMRVQKAAAEANSTNPVQNITGQATVPRRQQSESKDSVSIGTDDAPSAEVEDAVMQPPSLTSPPVRRGRSRKPTNAEADVVSEANSSQLLDLVDDSKPESPLPSENLKPVSEPCPEDKSSSSAKDESPSEEKIAKSDANDETSPGEDAEKQSPDSKLQLSELTEDQASQKGNGEPASDTGKVPVEPVAVETGTEGQGGELDSSEIISEDKTDATVTITPKRRGRGRPRKVSNVQPVANEDITDQSVDVGELKAVAESMKALPAVTRRKSVVEKDSKDKSEVVLNETGTEDEVVKDDSKEEAKVEVVSNAAASALVLPPRRRGRPRKYHEFYEKEFPQRRWSKEELKTDKTGVEHEQKVDEQVLAEVAVDKVDKTKENALTIDTHPADKEMGQADVVTAKDLTEQEDGSLSPVSQRTDGSGVSPSEGAKMEEGPGKTGRGRGRPRKRQRRGRPRTVTGPSVEAKEQVSSTEELKVTEVAEIKEVKAETATKESSDEKTYDPDEVKEAKLSGTDEKSIEKLELTENEESGDLRHAPDDVKVIVTSEDPETCELMLAETSSESDTNKVEQKGTVKDEDKAAEKASTQAASEEEQKIIHKPVVEGGSGSEEKVPREPEGLSPSSRCTQVETTSAVSESLKSGEVNSTPVVKCQSPFETGGKICTPAPRTIDDLQVPFHDTDEAEISDMMKKEEKGTPADVSGHEDQLNLFLPQEDCEQEITESVEGKMVSPRTENEKDSMLSNLPANVTVGDDPDSTAMAVSSANPTAEPSCILALKDSDGGNKSLSEISPSKSEWSARKVTEGVKIVLKLKRKSSSDRGEGSTPTTPTSTVQSDFNEERSSEEKTELMRKQHTRRDPLPEKARSEPPPDLSSTTQLAEDGKQQKKKKRRNEFEMLNETERSYHKKKKQKLQAEAQNDQLSDATDREIAELTCSPVVQAIQSVPVEVPVLNRTQEVAVTDDAEEGVSKLPQGEEPTAQADPSSVGPSSSGSPPQKVEKLVIKRRIPSPTKMKTRGKQNRLWYLFAKQSKPSKAMKKEKLAMSGTVEELMAICKPCSVKLIDLIKYLNILSHEGQPGDISPVSAIEGSPPQQETAQEDYTPSSILTTSPSAQPKDPQDDQPLDLEEALLALPAAQTNKRALSESPEASAESRMVKIPWPRSEGNSPTAKRSKLEPSSEGERQFLSFIMPKPVLDQDFPTSSPSSHTAPRPVLTRAPVTARKTMKSPASARKSVQSSKHVTSPPVERSGLHQVSPLRTTKFSCLHCSFTSSVRSVMSQHVYSHADIMPYSCGHCSNWQGSRSSVLSHHKQAHQGMPPDIVKNAEICEEDYYITCDMSKNPMPETPGLSSPPQSDRFDLPCFRPDLMRTVPPVLTNNMDGNQSKGKAVSLLNPAVLTAQVTAASKAASPGKSAYPPSTNTSTGESPPLGIMVSSTPVLNSVNKNSSPLSPQPAQPVVNKATNGKDATGPKVKIPKRPRIPLLDNVDPNQPYYQCRHCTHASNSLQCIKNHVVMQHKGEQCYQCPLCEHAYFKSTAAVEKHNSKHHPNETVQLQLQADFYDVNQKDRTILLVGTSLYRDVLSPQGQSPLHVIVSQEGVTVLGTSDASSAGSSTAMNSPQTSPASFPAALPHPVLSPPQPVLVAQKLGMTSPLLPHSPEQAESITNTKVPLGSPASHKSDSAMDNPHAPEPTIIATAAPGGSERSAVTYPGAPLLEMSAPVSHALARDDPMATADQQLAPMTQVAAAVSQIAASRTPIAVAVTEKSAAGMVPSSVVIQKPGAVSQKTGPANQKPGSATQKSTPRIILKVPTIAPQNTILNSSHSIPGMTAAESKKTGEATEAVRQCDSPVSNRTASQILMARDRISPLVTPIATTTPDETPPVEVTLEAEQTTVEENVKGVDEQSREPEVENTPVTSIELPGTNEDIEAPEVESTSVPEVAESSDSPPPLMILNVVSLAGQSEDCMGAPICEDILENNQASSVSTSTTTAEQDSGRPVTSVEGTIEGSPSTTATDTLQPNTEPTQISESFSCKFCAKIFGNIDDVITHIGEDHKMRYWYACPYCPFGCSRHKSNMLRHIARAHQDESDDIQITITDEDQYFTRMAGSSLDSIDKSPPIEIDDDLDIEILPLSKQAKLEIKEPAEFKYQPPIGVKSSTGEMKSVSMIKTEPVDETVEPKTSEKGCSTDDMVSNKKPPVPSRVVHDDDEIPVVVGAEPRKQRPVGEIKPTLVRAPLSVPSGISRLGPAVTQSVSPQPRIKATSPSLHLEKSLRAAGEAMEIDLSSQTYSEGTRGEEDVIVTETHSSVITMPQVDQPLNLQIAKAGEEDQPTDLSFSPASHSSKDIPQDLSQVQDLSKPKQRKISNSSAGQGIVPSHHARLKSGERSESVITKTPPPAHQSYQKYKNPPLVIEPKPTSANYNRSRPLNQPITIAPLADCPKARLPSSTNRKPLPAHSHKAVVRERSPEKHIRSVSKSVISPKTSVLSSSISGQMAQSRHNKSTPHRPVSKTMPPLIRIEPNKTQTKPLPPKSTGPQTFHSSQPSLSSSSSSSESSIQTMCTEPQSALSSLERMTKRRVDDLLPKKSTKIDTHRKLIDDRYADEEAARKAFSVFNLKPPKRKAKPAAAAGAAATPPASVPTTHSSLQTTPLNIPQLPTGINKWRQFQSTNRPAVRPPNAYGAFQGAQPGSLGMAAAAFQQAHLRRTAPIAARQSIRPQMSAATAAAAAASFMQRPPQASASQSGYSSAAISTMAGGRVTSATSHIPCPYCAFEAEDADAIHDHILAHEPDIQIQWSCPYCPLPNRMSKPTVTKHIQNCHPKSTLVYIPYGVPLQ